MANQSSAARKPDLKYDVTTRPAGPRKWEFRVAKLDPNVRSSEDAILADASANGWELVSVTESANFDRRYYFKRPL